MHTKDFLAQELRKAGLEDMANKAAEGYYHDFLSPLATPCLQLGIDLENVGTKAAGELLKRHFNGEFDANTEESEDWANSKEGKEAFSLLSRKK